MLITGASSGIGEATAIRVGVNGARVLLVSRTREKLTVQAKIEEVGGEAHVHPCDLTDTTRSERWPRRCWPSTAVSTC